MEQTKHQRADMTGSIAIVIGGSSGIGQSAAIELAGRGAGIILTYNRHRDGADHTVAHIQAAGGKAVAIQFDAARSGDFASFRDAVTQALNDNWQRATFEYLVNNAGVGETMMFENTTEEVFDTLINVNLKAPFFITQKLLPLLEDGGAIVNVTSSSTLATSISEGSSAYAAAKGGLTVLSAYMAKEFSKRGIRVNSIAPGPTKTRFGNDGFERFPELIAPIAARTALGRVGESGDLGKAIASLLSDDWRWITGQNIEVSGGFNLGFSLF